MSDNKRSELSKRSVRSLDPSLSDRANDLLTRELQEVVGETDVDVPVGNVDHRAEAHGGHSSFVTQLRSNRLAIAMTLGAAVVIGAIFALSTGSVLALVAVLLVHVTGTTVVILTAVRTTTSVEHVDSTTASVLESEGVSDPDGVLQRLLHDFDDRSDPSEHRTTEADADPASTSGEQKTAGTPTSGQSRSVG